MFFKLPNEPEGRFYDNIRVGLHGQSTSGFGKKAQNVNFNADNRFHWSTGESEISTMNLLSNYSDKTKVRNKMAWDFWNRTRHPSHWCQMVRVQQVIPSTVNAGVAAQFYGLWDMTEDGNSDFLKRWGLDENGALYKCYNSLDNARQTTSNSSGVEKKTREWENFSDLQALVTALNPANALNNRRQWTYDNVDVPARINLLAVHAFIRSNDYGHKNYYIYRDLNGSQEWTLLPWDQDLSFGHTWVSGPAYFDDDIDSARGLLLGNTTGNYLMRLAVNESGSQELAQMYLRRIRTLMDTYLGTTASPITYLSDRITAFQDSIDATPGGFAAGADDADLDYRKWGYGLDGSGSLIAYTNVAANDHFIRNQGLRLISSNPNPPYPSASPYSTYGTNPIEHTTVPPFLPGRRDYLYRIDADRPRVYPGSLNLPIPGTQPASPPLAIESVVFNPGAVGQDQEYFIIRNTGSDAVDLSDWKLTGEVRHTFKPGTVIPGAGTPTSDGGQRHVCESTDRHGKGAGFSHPRDFSEIWRIPVHAVRIQRPAFRARRRYRVATAGRSPESRHEHLLARGVPIVRRLAYAAATRSAHHGTQLRAIRTQHCGTRRGARRAGEGL